MKATRRGFFGILAAAPAAAKALPAQLESLAAPGGFPVYQSTEHYLDIQSSYAIPEGKDGDITGYIKALRERLARIEDDPEYSLESIRREVVRLDPDLALNRSMSLSVKINEQAKRIRERRILRQKCWFEEQLAKCMGQV